MPAVKVKNVEALTAQLNTGRETFVPVRLTGERDVVEEEGVLIVHVADALAENLKNRIRCRVLPIQVLILIIKSIRRL